MEKLTYLMTITEKPRQLTLLQLNVLECIASGKGWFADIKDILAASGASTDGMAILNMVGRMLDAPIKLNPDGSTDYSSHGWIHREKKTHKSEQKLASGVKKIITRHQWFYTLTELGRQVYHDGFYIHYTPKWNVDPRWRSTTVLDLCETILQTQNWVGLMPILGDALMDAGCDNDTYIRVCRTKPLNKKHAVRIVEKLLEVELVNNYVDYKVVGTLVLYKGQDIELREKR